MLRAVRDSSAAIFLALLSTGLALIPTAARAGYYFCAVAAAFAALTVVMHIAAEYGFQKKRRKLSTFWVLAHELAMRSNLHEEDAFAAWTTELIKWTHDTRDYLRDSLSGADAALFVALPTYHMTEDFLGAYSGKRGEWQQEHEMRMATLRQITERFLSQRD